MKTTKHNNDLFKKMSDGEKQVWLNNTVERQYYFLI